MMNRARQLRLDRGLGLLETADGAGVTSRTLKKIEAGEDISPASLRRLADFYEISPPSELLAPAIFGAPATGDAA